VIHPWAMYNVADHVCAALRMMYTILGGVQCRGRCATSRMKYGVADEVDALCILQGGTDTGIGRNDWHSLLCLLSTTLSWFRSGGKTGVLLGWCSAAI
jgi:hypothetical protein